MMLNDNELFIKERVKCLDQFLSDVESLFILHFAYIFFLNDHYFMASNYIDSLEVGIPPEENSQYWVAPFIQDVFDKIIKIKRPDVADFIKKNTASDLK